MGCILILFIFQVQHLNIENLIKTALYESIMLFLTCSRC
eukprot:UN09883